MGNTVEPETSQLEALFRRLQEWLPADWSATREAPGAGEPDAILELKAPDGTGSRIVVEFKTRAAPADVDSAFMQLSRYLESFDADGAMFVSPFLSPRTRELLKARGLNYADATGNLWLNLQRPALLLSTQGADKDPSPPRRQPLRSLKGRSAGRIVRAILDFAPPYTVTELAKLADSNPPMVYRVFEFLEEQAIIIREPRGAVTDLDWRALLDAWTRDYSFTTSNRISSYLAPRGFVNVVERIGRSRVAATGSMAAAGREIAPARLLALYVEDLRAVAEKLELREVETGANVILAQPFDAVVFERTRRVDDLPLASVSQVAADLLTGPGRWPEEAEAMLAWMSQNEGLWRVNS